MNKLRWSEVLEENNKVNSKNKLWDYYVKPYIPKFYANIIEAHQLNNQTYFDPYYNPYNVLENQSQEKNAREEKTNITPQKKEIISKQPEKNVQILSKNNNSKPFEIPKNDLAKQILMTVKSEDEKKEEIGKELKKEEKNDGKELASQILKSVKPEEENNNKEVGTPPKKLLKVNSEEFKPGP